AGESVGGDWQQQVNAGEDAEVGLLVVGVQRIAHGDLGVRSRFPLGHVHLSPPRDEAISTRTTYKVRPRSQWAAACGLTSRLYDARKGRLEAIRDARSVAGSDHSTTDRSRIDHIDQYAIGGPLSAQERTKRKRPGQP